MMTRTTSYQRVGRILLGLGMLAAGMGHLTFQRKAFQAQVPEWVPLDKDLTVVLSGYVELALGLAMVMGGRYRARYGLALALFFVAVFPGNIAQYVNRTNAFGLDTDAKRFARLFLQPMLIVWALWSSGAYAAWRARRRGQPSLLAQEEEMEISDVHGLH